MWSRQGVSKDSEDDEKLVVKFNQDDLVSVICCLHILALPPYLGRQLGPLQTEEDTQGSEQAY